MFDIITLQANFYYLTEDRFNCQDKISRLAEKTTLEEATRLVNVSNGCNKVDEDYRYKIDNIRYHTCFCRFKHPQIVFFYNLFSQYEKGMLPFAGNLVDQPNYIMEVFAILGKLKTEKQEEDLKRQQAEDGRRINRHRAGNQSVQRGTKRK